MSVRCWAIRRRCFGRWPRPRLVGTCCAGSTPRDAATASLPTSGGRTASWCSSTLSTCRCSTVSTSAVRRCSTSTGPPTATRSPRRNRLSRIGKPKASTPSSCCSRRAQAATRRPCGSPTRWRCCAAPAWPTGSSSPPTMSATCRCRCSTRTALRRAGRWRWRAGRRWCPRSSRRRGSSPTSAATARRT